MGGDHLCHENNIQGVGRNGYRDAQTMKDPELVEREAAYVRKIVQEVNSFDNVILEVCDEPALFTPVEEAGPWVGHMLEVTHEAEANLPKKHLIGQEVQGPVDGPIDFSGNPLNSIVITQYLWHTHDWEMGGLQGLDREYRDNKPIEQNETNYYPLYSGDKIGASRVEAWEFMVGGGASFNQLNGLFTAEDPAGNTPENAKLLGALHSLKRFIESFSFVDMVPDRGFVVSGFDRETHYRGMSQYGKQYALYIHHSEGGRRRILCRRAWRIRRKPGPESCPREITKQNGLIPLLIPPSLPNTSSRRSSSRNQHTDLCSRHRPPH